MIRTYELEHGGKTPLYEQLYRAIRQDLLTGAIAGGERLPSKRALAEHLSVSKITVETAYAQLLAEGYITARQRSGYYAEHLAPLPAPAATPPVQSAPAPAPAETAETPSAALFPFSVWARLMRTVLLEDRPALLESVPSAGVWALRCAIAAEFGRLRGMKVAPEQVFIGSGTEYFYNLLIQFLGRTRRYGAELLGHRKLARVYCANGVAVCPLAMDGDGVLPQALRESGAQVLHISPAHQYPTGAVMPIARRQQILRWLAEDAERWVIEDDFDAEFRFSGLPIPPLQSMDPCGRVLYLNTFSKTLSPSLRISYLILPRQLLPRWQQTMGFYSCTVPSFEQFTLARFLSGGWFEKHLTRAKKYYRAVREQLLAQLAAPPCAGRFAVLGAGAGLHLLLRVRTALPDERLAGFLEQAGLEAELLSSFYLQAPPESARGCIVLHYADLRPETAGAALTRLCALLPE